MYIDSQSEGVDSYCFLHCGVFYQKCVDFCFDVIALRAGVLGYSSLAVSIQWVVLWLFYDWITLTFIEQIYWYCFKDYIIKFSALIFCYIEFSTLRIVTTLHKWDVPLSFFLVDRLRNSIVGFIQNKLENS